MHWTIKKSFNDFIYLYILYCRRIYRFDFAFLRLLMTSYSAAHSCSFIRYLYMYRVMYSCAFGYMANIGALRHGRKGVVFQVLSVINFDSRVNKYVGMGHQKPRLVNKFDHHVLTYLPILQLLCKKTNR